MQILRISESTYAMMRKKEFLRKCETAEEKTKKAQYFESLMKTADKLLRGTVFIYRNSASGVKENASIQFHINTWDDCEPTLRGHALKEIQHYLTVEQTAIVNEADKVLIENLTCKMADLSRFHAISQDYARECAQPPQLIKVSWSEFLTLKTELDRNEKYYPAIEFVTRDYLRAKDYERK